MASALFFLDKKAKPLLSRNYRGDVPMSAVEAFPMLLMEAEDETSVIPPTLSHNGINYLYLSHNDLYVLALSRENTNAMEVLLFLHRVVETLTGYLKELAEESIRDNFVVIYELLDEMMDFGFPQTTETKILKEYITQENRIFQLVKPVLNRRAPKPPVAVTNAVSWRSEGITYRKNEAFLDVVESINMLCSPSGQVLRSEILGRVVMKSYLSGMPELRLGLNDRVIFDHLTSSGASVLHTDKRSIEMEDVKFHQCVRLSRFESDRTISFIPPDGEFQLMSYRLNTNVKPLIWVDCKVRKHENSRIEMNVHVKAQFKARSRANDVEVIIPVPEDADSPKLRISQNPSGYSTVKWKPEQAAIVWKIKNFNGGKEGHLRAELGLPVVSADEEPSKRPIQVKFSIPYFTTSGMLVRYLKIVEPKLQYQSWPWVRYITQSGDYAIRMNNDK